MLSSICKNLKISSTIITVGSILRMIGVVVNESFVYRIYITHRQSTWKDVPQMIEDETARFKRAGTD